MGCRELQVNDYFRMTDSASGTDVPYYALADANKNITEYFDTNGNVVAHYEYSPFGKITQSSGTMVSDFDYRFSSEYADDETGLVYYNHRYYSAEWGRWLSRDPIEEQGGWNIYAMVNNDAINEIDYLGLDKCEINLFIGHGKKKVKGDPQTDADIDPDGDTGQYAQDQTDADPSGCSAVGIMGCWNVSTMNQVDKKRAKNKKAPVNWVNADDSNTYRSITSAGRGEDNIPGPGEPKRYTPKTAKQIKDSLKNNAVKKAKEICKKGCCKEVKIYFVKKALLWGFNKKLSSTVNCGSNYKCDK